MPMYEYKCGACGQVFELIQRFSDDPLTRHEGCGGAVERLISRSALQFKGSGWYINDYAKGGNAAGAKKDSDAAPSTEKADTPKADGVKPDSKKSDSSSTNTNAAAAADTKK